MQQQQQRKVRRRAMVAAATATAASLAAVIGGARQAHAAVTYVRNTSSSGNWSTTTAWTPNGVPNAAGDTADLSTRDITGTTVTVDVPVTIGTIKVGDTNNSNGYTISGGTITLDNLANAAVLQHTANGNNDTINSTLLLKGNLSLINSASSTTFTISGAQSSSAASGLQTITVTTGSINDTGAISDGTTGGQVAVTVNAAGKTSIFTGANTYTGPTTISAGAMRVSSSSLSTGSNLVLNGGTLESNAAFTFSRALGTGANQVQFTGPGGGFSANGGKLTVNLNNNGGTLVWGSTAGFLANGATLMFGSTTSNNETSLTNGIDLNGATRTVSVTAGTSANDFATLNGVVSDSSGGGTAGIIKTGTGTLNLAKDNTFAGPITVNQGAVRIGSANGIVDQPIVLNGGVIEGSSAYNGTIMSPGTGPGQIRWAGSGGFAANGAAFDVNLDGGTTQYWGQGDFVPNGSALVFGSTTANREVIFENNVNLGGGGVNRTITVNAAIGSTGADFVTMRGGIDSTDNSATLTKTGNGILNLGDSTNFFKGLTINGGVVRASRDWALGVLPDNPATQTSITFSGNGSLQAGDPALALDAQRIINVNSFVGSFDTAGNSFTSFDNKVTGSGTFQKTGAGTLTFTSTNSTVATVNAAGGTLVYATRTSVAPTVSAGGGTLVIPAGGAVTIPNVNVGLNATGTSTFTVTNGAQLTIGTSATNSVNIAARNNGVSQTVVSNALFDASKADLLTIKTGTVRIGVDFSTSAQNGGLSGTMRGAVNMAIVAAGSFVIGESSSDATNGVQESLVLGTGTTTIATPLFIAGGKKYSSSVTIGTGGTLTLTGTTPGAVTDLRIGMNNVGTGASPNSKFDMSAGTLIADLGNVIVGEKSAGSTGGVTASFILGPSANNLVNMNSLTLANFSSTGAGATATATLGGGQVNLLGNVISGGGTSTLNLSGATVDMKGHSIGTSASNAPTNMNFTAGILRDAADIFRPLAQSGASTLLDVATTDTTIHGAYTLSGGSAMVAAGHTLTADSILISNGGTLGGEGTVVGPVAIGMVGGTGGTELAPGATTGDVGTLVVNGDLALENNATFLADLVGGNADAIDVNGLLDLSSADKLNLLAGSGAYDGTTSYTIATFDQLMGQFDTVTGLDPNYELVYGANSIQVAPTGVPEPTTLSLLALGGTALLSRRRRRTQA